MLREYHFGFDELLDTELRRFWFLYGQIERLRSEDDLRQMSILSSVNSAEAFEKKITALGNQMGEIFIFTGSPGQSSDYVVDPTKKVEEQAPDPTFDRNKFSALKAKFASGR